MKYRRIISLFVAAALLPLSQAQARPHFDGPDRDDDRREHHHHHRDRDRIYYPGPVRVYPGPVHMYAPPVRYNIMPPGYKTVIAAGLRDPLIF